MPPSRRRRWLAEGSEPDPRFTLANERTFLAWIRTAVAFIGGGLAVAVFLPETLGHDVVTVVAGILVVTGVAMAAGSYQRWLRAQHALRTARPLPPPALAAPLAYGVSLSGIALLIVIAMAR